MVPTRALREKAMQLLAADAATLAPAANANKIALVKAAFVPAETLVFADLDLADFDGSTPILGNTGAQPEGLDPATNDSLVDITPPVTGYRFETTGVTNLPQTIYGFALVNNAADTLLASGLFDAPIELTAINQRVDVVNPTLRQLANSIS